MFPHYSAQNLLFAELLHKLVYIKDAPYILFPLLFLTLFWLISKKIFKKNLVYIPVLIFLVSPWMWYLAFAYSFYIFLFSLVLPIVYGVILLRSGDKAFGNIFVVLGSFIAMYSSSLFFIFIPISITIMVISKVVSLKQFKTSIVLLFILVLPLLFLIVKNNSAFKSNFVYEVQIFSDPGLLNSINRYQGAATEAGFKNLARISENKYIFYAEYFLGKYASQMVPETLFTPQYKLLGFSFNPPILLGFLIPFGYGLYKLLQNPKARRILLISTLLVIPSVLAKDLVSLNRLILFCPVVIIVISYGLIQFYENRKNNTARIFLILTLILVIFQLIVVLADIKVRETQRFDAYFGKNYELIEP